MARFLKHSGAFESATQAEAHFERRGQDKSPRRWEIPRPSAASPIFIPPSAAPISDGALALEVEEVVGGASERTNLRPEEAAVLALLSGRQSGAVSL